MAKKTVAMHVYHDMYTRPETHSYKTLGALQQLLI